MYYRATMRLRSIVFAAIAAAATVALLLTEGVSIWTAMGTVAVLGLLFLDPIADRLDQALTQKGRTP